MASNQRSREERFAGLQDLTEIRWGHGYALLAENDHALEIAKALDRVISLDIRVKLTFKDGKQQSGWLYIEALERKKRGDKPFLLLISHSYQSWQRWIVPANDIVAIEYANKREGDRSLHGSVFWRA